jgi:hypothetical protein
MSEMEYENHGMKWTVTETKQLLKETRKINDLDTIASIHKRSPYAIYLKLVKEASKIADEDYEISLKDLAEIVGLKPQALVDGFKKIKYDFKNDDDYNPDDDSDEDSEISEEEVNDIIKDTEKEEVKIVKKKVIILPVWASVAVILINLSGLYYFLLMNKLI